MNEQLNTSILGFSELLKRFGWRFERQICLTVNSEPCYLYSQRAIGTPIPMGVHTPPGRGTFLEMGVAPFCTSVTSSVSPVLFPDPSPTTDMGASGSFSLCSAALPPRPAALSPACFIFPAHSLSTLSQMDSSLLAPTCSYAPRSRISGWAPDTAVLLQARPGPSCSVCPGNTILRGKGR